MAVTFVTLPVLPKIPKAADKAADIPVALPKPKPAVLAEAPGKPAVSRAPSESKAASTQPTDPAAASAPGATSATQSPGNASDDPTSRYHAALRRAIRAKWADLTDHPFPTGCALHLEQTAGGGVAAASAGDCALSQEDRRQLEAAALMAQPLPYAGFESLFLADLALEL